MNDAAELELARKRLSLIRQLRDRRAANPIEWYQPHQAGQLQFHQALQKYRVLVPGNGWGKTTAAGAEVHWWATHTHPYQATPTHPIIGIWFVKLKEQFELVRRGLEEFVFGNVPKYTDDSYGWPDGSTLHMASADRANDWMKWQGVPADLVVFDEEPPQRLWEEMTLRRRAQRKTRFVIAATATSGDSWMEQVLYKPWLHYHQGLGFDETRAMDKQLYRSAFVWPRGGIDDNPGADQDDREHYREATALMHPNERKVRLFGGFASWTGDPVFLASAVQWLDDELERQTLERGEGRIGILEPAVIPRR